MRNKPRKKHTLPSDIKNTLVVAGADWGKIPMFGILTARSKSHLFNRHYNGIGISYPEVKGVDHKHWLAQAKQVNAANRRKRNSQKELLMAGLEKFAVKNGLPFLTREDKLQAIKALRKYRASLMRQTETKPGFHDAGNQVMTRVKDFKPSMPNRVQVQVILRRNSTHEKENPPEKPNVCDRCHLIHE